MNAPITMSGINSLSAVALGIAQLSVDAAGPRRDGSNRPAARRRPRPDRPGQGR